MKLKEAAEKEMSKKTSTATKAEPMSKRRSNKLTNKTRAPTKKEEIEEEEEQNPKKRGRKLENWREYKRNSCKKITNIMAKLKNAVQDGIDIKERQRLRNQAEALKSRVKKKMEVKYLHKLIAGYKERNVILLDLLKTTLKKD